MTEEVTQAHVITDAMVARFWPDMNTPEGRTEIRRQWDEMSAHHLPTDLSEERAREVLASCDRWQDVLGGGMVIEPDGEFVKYDEALRAMQQYAAGLQGEVERLQNALAYLTSCTAATVEGFTAKTPKYERRRHAEILSMMADALEGRPLNTRGTKTGWALERCKTARTALGDTQ